MEFWRDTFIVNPTREHSPQLTATPLNAIASVTKGRGFYAIRSTLGSRAEKKTSASTLSYQALKSALQDSKRELLEVKDRRYGPNDPMTHLVVLDHVDGVISDEHNRIHLYLHGGSYIDAPGDQLENLLARYQATQTPHAPIVRTNLPRYEAADDKIHIAVKPHFLKEVCIAEECLYVTFGSSKDSHRAEARFNPNDPNVRAAAGLDPDDISHSLFVRLNEMANKEVQKVVADLLAVRPELMVIGNLSKTADHL